MHNYTLQSPETTKTIVLFHNRAIFRFNNLKTMAAYNVEQHKEGETDNFKRVCKTIGLFAIIIKYSKRALFCKC